MVRHGVTREITQPRRGRGIVDMVPALWNEFHLVAKALGHQEFETVEGIGCIAREDIAVKAFIDRSRTQAKPDVAQIFRRRVFQRFATRHGACRRPIVGIEGSDALAAVTALGNTEYVDFVGINVGAQKSLAQQAFPSELLAALIPAVPLSLVGNLRNEVEARRVLEHLCEFQARGPFAVARPAAVQIEEERISARRLLAFADKIIIERGLRLEAIGQQPFAAVGGVNRFKGNEFFLFKRLIGLLPRLPNRLSHAADLTHGNFLLGHGNAGRATFFQGFAKIEAHVG